MPEDLRRRLAGWIDVEEVGADGFWLWLGTVLPLLPATDESGDRRPGGEGPSVDRMRELARNLVDCGRERARLTVMAERYYTDNQQLARRLKALEAALKTFERAGQRVEVAEDEPAAEASERYLPHR